MNADSGLMHNVVSTAANVHDLHAVNQLHGKKKHVFAGSEYRGIERWSRRKRIHWSIALRPGQRRALNRNDPIDAPTERIEKVRASIPAKVEHPFRAIKRQFGYVRRDITVWPRTLRW